MKNGPLLFVRRKHKAGQDASVHFNGDTISPDLCSSAQQRENVAGPFDHLLLLRRRVNEFDAVCESGAVPDDSPHHKLGRVIRKQEFKAETAPLKVVQNRLRARDER